MNRRDWRRTGRDFEHRTEDEPERPRRPDLGIGNQAMQQASPAQLARWGGLSNSATQWLARNGGTYPSKEGTEFVLTPEGSDEAMPNGYRRFMYGGGRVWMRDRKNPMTRLDTGWTRNGYTDIVKHATEDQGRGSAWVSTSQDMNIDPGYGQFLYEIEVSSFMGVDVNTAVQTISRHRNPHAERQEIAVFKRLPPSCIKAVWVERGPNNQVPQHTSTDHLERYTPNQFRMSFQAGEFAHINFT